MERKLILCMPWAKRSGFVDCVKVPCSTCQTELAMDRANVPLALEPICVDCVQKVDDVECGGGAVGGKIVSVREAMRQIFHDIAGRN